jgi:hypothetical protein
VGVSIAYRGLSRWREELIGRRRTELAEDVLSSFYQMRDIIGDIRSPAAHSDEGKDRPKAEEDEGDPEALRRTKDTYYVPISRYNEHQKVIADLMSKRYRMKAVFGPVATEPFTLLSQVFSQIISAARKLITNAGKPGADRRIDAVEKWEAVIWWGAAEGDDAMDKKVKSAIEAIEKICRPVLEARK